MQDGDRTRLNGPGRYVVTTCRSAVSARNERKQNLLNARRCYELVLPVCEASMRKLRRRISAKPPGHSGDVPGSSCFRRIAPAQRIPAIKRARSNTALHGSRQPHMLGYLVLVHPHTSSTFSLISLDRVQAPYQSRSWNCRSFNAVP